MQITPLEIPIVAQLVDQLCGVVLDETKGYLIDSRLGTLAEEAGCTDFGEFCRKARSDQALQKRITEAITTQETLFFRDASPFEALQHKAIPELIDTKIGTPYTNRIRIWSAACSTGQEPYSIAMTLRELIPDVDSWDISILATDISNSAITQASRGRYANHEIQRGMTPRMLAEYFTQEPSGWKVKDQLRAMVHFERRNLLESFAALGSFDVVFCRNVAIYFTTEVKRDLFQRLAAQLSTDGYLFVGSSECLATLDPRFVAQHHCRSIFYQPNRLPALT